MNAHERKKAKDRKEGATFGAFLRLVGIIVSAMFIPVLYAHEPYTILAPIIGIIGFSSGILVDIYEKN